MTREDGKKSGEGFASPPSPPSSGLSSPLASDPPVMSGSGLGPRALADAGFGFARLALRSLGRSLPRSLARAEAEADEVARVVSPGPLAKDPPTEEELRAAAEDVADAVAAWRERNRGGREERDGV